MDFKIEFTAAIASSRDIKKVPADKLTFRTDHKAVYFCGPGLPQRMGDRSDRVFHATLTPTEARILGHQLLASAEMVTANHVRYQRNLEHQAATTLASRSPES